MGAFQNPLVQTGLSMIPGYSQVSSLFGFGGGSKCSGPYDMVNGQCVPKPANWGGWNNPANAAARQQLIGPGSGGTMVTLPPTPGITTPGEYGLTGEYQAVTDGFGVAAVAPRVETRQRLKCPPGTVLGKNDLCYRGSPPGGRKWKKDPRPIISASDAKTLRKIGRIQSRVKKAAGTAGFTCKKR